MRVIYSFVPPISYKEFIAFPPEGTNIVDNIVIMENVKAHIIEDEDGYCKFTFLAGFDISKLLSKIITTYNVLLNISLE